MTYVKIMALLAAALLVGCGDLSKPMPKKVAVKKDHDHDEHGPGPNGGVVFDLGKYHAEFTVDHDKKECTVLMLGGDGKTVKTVAATELTVTTKEAKTKDGKAVAALTIKLVPKDEKDGKASRFVGSDPGLGTVVDFEGAVIGEIDGKPSSGEFKE